MKLKLKQWWSCKSVFMKYDYSPYTDVLTFFIQYILLYIPISISIFNIIVSFINIIWFGIVTYFVKW